MNGFLSWTLMVALQSGVCFQGGVEYGWTQLPDDRVEYIIQLDEAALDALKNGQPILSSIPPEIQHAQRIRVQFGSGVLAKPMLTRKPQTGFAGGGNQGLGNSEGTLVESVTVADMPPALQRQDFGNPALYSGGLPTVGTNKQVTVRDGNENRVSASSLSGATPTAFVTQDGSGGTPNWSNSNRVISNFDNQNRPTGTGSVYPPARTAERGGGAVNPPPRSLDSNTGRAGGGVNPPPANSSVSNDRGFGGANGSGSGVANNGLNKFRDNNNATPDYNNRMTPMNNNGVGANNNPGAWNSINNSNRSSANYDPNNPRSNYQNNGVQNPQPMNGFQNPVTNQGPINTFPNAQTPYQNNPYQNSMTNPGYHPPLNMPVSTTAPSNDVANLNKTIEEMKNQRQQEKHEEEMANLKADHKAKFEELRGQFIEFQKKKEETPSAVAPPTNKDSEDKRGSSSGIASVFLVISLGLNVFLVVQYLSVQNQFRDLSNDLRDTFMTNSYE